MFRKKLGNRHSKRLFSRTADTQHIHPKNQTVAGVWRGGIRF